MGSKYPVLTPDEVTRTLKKFGFYFVSQKGSHFKL
jgi:predicted RNA binding protein YcfA (HicA-like mRNA interferase family)